MKKNYQRIFAATLVIVCLLIFSGCASNKLMAGGELVPWRDLENGEKEAAEKNMPVLVDFFSAVNCIRCEALVETIYSNPKIAERINKDFVPVRINKHFEPTIAETILVGKLESGGECILAFLDQNGNIVKNKNGEQISSMEKLTPEKFLWYMDEALKNI